jgi:hypothetical protein
MLDFTLETNCPPVEGRDDNRFTRRDTGVLFGRAFVASKDKLRLLGSYPLPDGSQMQQFSRRDGSAR